MKKTSETILFFGSGPVAAKSLELLSKDFVIEAVVTKPKPAHHKGSFPVLDVSDTLNLPVHTVSNKEELSALIDKKAFKSRLSVLIDFGIIVGKDVIDYFPLGIVNSHFSLLPKWRGADPITFAVLSGQKTTGVSLMLLVESMDEGPLLAQTPVPIRADTTTPQLTHELIEVSHNMLAQTLPLYFQNSIQPMAQEQASIAEDKKPTYSRKLTKQDGKIDWQKPAEQIEREIRAFLGWPGSYAKVGDQDVIITKAKTAEEKSPPGKITVDNGRLLVGCSKGTLEIEALKPAGKKEMTAEAFLAGYKSKITD